MGAMRDWIEEEERRARRFGEMIARLGVDMAELSRDERGATLRRAVGRCRACDSACACEAWLAREGPEDAPSFCPNLPAFSRLR